MIQLDPLRQTNHQLRAKIQVLQLEHQVRILVLQIDILKLGWIQ